MARIRNLKPDFWTDEKLVELEPWERLLFIGLWNFADDQGYMPFSPKRIKMQVFPADSLEVSRGLQSLISIGALTLYDSESGQVLHITNWHKHQKVSNPSKSKYDDMDLTPARQKPRKQAEVAPENTEDYLNPLEDSGGLHKEREGGRGMEREGVSSLELRTHVTSAEKPKTVDDVKFATLRIVNTWIDGQPNRPPGKVINDVKHQIAPMIQDGINPQHITAGLAQWWEGNYPPSTLPNYVRVAQRGTQAPAASGTTRARQTLQLAHQLEQEEQGR